jgi:uncharacterized protein (DUF488 family)
MMAMVQQVYLTGYELESADQFLKKLEKYKVSRLVDIRELPLSRKKGFSKNALRENLREHGIAYTHLRSLGSPRKIRKELHDGEIDYAVFFKAYRNHLHHNHDAMTSLVATMTGEVIALMCYEVQSELCHRSIVADELTKAQPKTRVASI